MTAVGGLALLERLTVPAAAWALFEEALLAKTALVIAVGVIHALRGFAQRVFAARTEADLANRAIASLLDGDLLQASVLPDEDARTELAQGIFEASQQLVQGLPTLVTDVVASALLALIVVCVEPGRVVLLAGAIMLVAAATLAWSRSRAQKAVSGAWSLQQRVFEHLVDALEGRAEVVALGLRAHFLAESRARTRAWGSAGARIAASSMLSGRLPLVGIAAVGAFIVLADARRTGAVGVPPAHVALLASIAPAFAGIAQGLHTMVRAERWVGLVAKVVEGARPGAAGGHPPPRIPARIEFDRVSFRYPDAGEDALRDVSFSWDGEDVLALAGANGSGKSTCLRLLLALGRPQKGAIRIGGVDLRDAALDALRAHVAFLPQRPYLPQRADIRTAVRLLAPNASDARIVASLDRVGVLAALRPLGSDPLDVRIDTLSVGQRQRVALARILCRDASMLVLDEPDANLDRQGITMVAEILGELARDRMIVFAAHTPELMAIAGRTLTLDAGRVVRDETRERPAVATAR
jgi:ABC-type multidrug transport system fused ATPase/permease subunit